MKTKRDLLSATWKGVAISFAGVITFFSNLFLKYPNYRTLGEEIALYVSGSVAFSLALVFVLLTIKLWRELD